MKGDGEVDINEFFEMFRLSDEYYHITSGQQTLVSTTTNRRLAPNRQSFQLDRAPDLRAFKNSAHVVLKSIDIDPVKMPNSGSSDAVSGMVSNNSSDALVGMNPSDLCI